MSATIGRQSPYLSAMAKDWEPHHVHASSPPPDKRTMSTPPTAHTPLPPNHNQPHPLNQAMGWGLSFTDLSVEDRGQVWECSCGWLNNPKNRVCGGPVKNGYPRAYGCGLDLQSATLQKSQKKQHSLEREVIQLKAELDRAKENSTFSKEREEQRREEKEEVNQLIEKLIKQSKFYKNQVSRYGEALDTLKEEVEAREASISVTISDLEDSLQDAREWSSKQDRHVQEQNNRIYEIEERVNRESSRADRAVGEAEKYSKETHEWTGRTLKLWFILNEMKKVGLSQSEWIFDLFEDFEMPNIPRRIREEFLPCSSDQPIAYIEGEEELIERLSEEAHEHAVQSELIPEFITWLATTRTPAYIALSASRIQAAFRGFKHRGIHFKINKEEDYATMERKFHDMERYNRFYTDNSQYDNLLMPSSEFMRNLRQDSRNIVQSRDRVNVLFVNNSPYTKLVRWLKSDGTYQLRPYKIKPWNIWSTGTYVNHRFSVWTVYNDTIIKTMDMRITSSYKWSWMSRQPRQLGVGLRDPSCIDIHKGNIFPNLVQPRLRTLLKDRIDETTAKEQVADWAELDLGDYMSHMFS